MLSRSWAALAVLTLACAANTPPRPGDYLDDDSMIRRGKIALADDPGSAATRVARLDLEAREQ